MRMYVCMYMEYPLCDCMMLAISFAAGTRRKLFWKRTKTEKTGCQAPATAVYSGAQKLEWCFSFSWCMHLRQYGSRKEKARKAWIPLVLMAHGSWLMANPNAIFSLSLFFVCANGWFCAMFLQPGKKKRIGNNVDICDISLTRSRMYVVVVLVPPIIYLLPFTPSPHTLTPSRPLNPPLGGRKKAILPLGWKLQSFY